MSFVLLFGLVRVLFFAVWAGARAPPKQQKKSHRPNSQKMINTPPPLPSVFLFVAVWAGGCMLFFAVWAGGVFFFFFCCLGGVVLFFLLFGRGGRVIFFGFLGGGAFLFFGCLGRGREFTHLPVCLARL